MKTEVILSSAVDETLRSLKSRNTKENRILLKGIESKFSLLRTDPHYGDPLARRMIPANLMRQYGLSNLFRIELPFFWRALYTITRSEASIIIFIVWMSNHREYDELFGYRKR